MSTYNHSNHGVLIDNNIKDMSLTKEVLVEGTGSCPPQGTEVSVHYTGKFPDGSKFDSSVDRGEPFKFTVGAGQVIRGWDEGVASMKKGEKCLLTCHPAYAYGDGGMPPVIPPRSTLIFEVELLDF